MSWTLVLWVVLPLVPVMVTVKVPVVAAAEAETVRVELPEVATEPGLKLAVTPEGKLPVFNATLPVKPLSAATLTV